MNPLFQHFSVGSMNELILNNARNVEIYIFKKSILLSSYHNLFLYIIIKFFGGAEFIEKRVKVKFDIFSNLISILLK